MALDNKNYLPSFQVAKVTGVESTLTAFYCTITAGINGTAVAPVFNTSSGTTAPVAGTVTGFYVASAGTNGSAVLWGTTAGTIAIIAIGTTVGVFQGTAVLNAAVAAGDTLQVYTTTSNTGTATAFVNFQTQN